MADEREWIVATTNAGKLAEMSRLLAASRIRSVGLGEILAPPLPEEGEQYESNARAKARCIAAATGRAAVADDSGLEVDALGGRPGARSARHGGPGLDDAGRIARLLDELRGVVGARRSARFVCVVALATPEGAEILARGVCEGRILEAPSGRGGFGYDPVFAPLGHDRSMAELGPHEKDAISHRGRAVAALLSMLAPAR